MRRAFSVLRINLEATAALPAYSVSGLARVLLLRAAFSVRAPAVVRPVVGSSASIFGFGGSGSSGTGS